MYSIALAERISIGILPFDVLHCMYDDVAKMFAAGLSGGNVAFSRVVEKS